MGANPIRVLMIEDNPADARMIEELLKEASASAAGRASDSRYEVSWKDRLDEGLDRLKSGGLEVVLLDLTLPDSTGGETFRRVLAAAGHVPVILLTGLQDEALGFEAVRQGVQDYLVKGKFDNRELIRALQYAIERERVEQALRQTKEALEAIVAATPAAVISLDTQGRVLTWNESA